MPCELSTAQLIVSGANHSMLSLIKDVATSEHLRLVQRQGLFNVFIFADGSSIMVHRGMAEVKVGQTFSVQPQQPTQRMRRFRPITSHGTPAVDQFYRDYTHACHVLDQYEPQNATAGFSVQSLGVSEDGLFELCDVRHNNTQPQSDHAKPSC